MQDMTNLPTYSATSDAIQLRPFEVLCEVKQCTAALLIPRLNSRNLLTLHPPLHVYSSLLTHLRPLTLSCSLHSQVWADLRSQGIKTPEIAAWQRMPMEGTPFNSSNKAKAIYPYLLNVYNDARFQQVP